MKVQEARNSMKVDTEGGMKDSTETRRRRASRSGGTGFSGDRVRVPETKWRAGFPQPVWPTEAGGWRREMSTQASHTSSGITPTFIR